MIKNRQELSILIKDVMQRDGVTMLDAIVHICDKYSVEEEVVAAYIRQSHKLKEELRTEAIKLKMVNQ